MFVNNYCVRQLLQGAISQRERWIEWLRDVSSKHGPVESTSRPSCQLIPVRIVEGICLRVRINTRVLLCDCFASYPTWNAGEWESTDQKTSRTEAVMKNQWRRTLKTQVSQKRLTCWTNAGLMLGQRRRRWRNINPALVCVCWVRCVRVLLVCSRYRGVRILVEEYKAGFIAYTRKTPFSTATKSLIKESFVVFRVSLYATWRHSLWGFKGHSVTYWRR